MKLKTFIVLSLMAFLVAVSCKKDIIEKDPTDLSRNYALNEIEQKFFDLQNSTFLLERTILSGRSAFPESLLKVYNDMLASNDEHHFVSGLVERAGYPLWTEALVDVSSDSTAFLVNIPFIRPNETSVRAILTCLITGSEGSILQYSIQSKRDLDDILAGNAATGPGTCRASMHFSAFNYAIFGEQKEAYDDLICETCFPDNDGGNFKPEEPVTERSCQTKEITYCFYDEPTGPLPTIINTTGGGGSTNGGWFVYDPVVGNDIVIIGPFGNPGGVNNEGGGGFDINISIGGFLAGIGHFIHNLFERRPRCPRQFLPDPDDGISTRNGEVVYACQTFTTVMCQNGDGWWDIVESWPCPECDGNLTMEEYHAQLCQENKLAFLATYDINPADLKKLGVTFEDCCEEGEFDGECGLMAIFTKIGLDEEEISTIFNLDLELNVISFLSDKNYDDESKIAAKNIIGIIKNGWLSGPYPEQQRDAIIESYGFPDPTTYYEYVTWCVILTNQWIQQHPGQTCGNACSFGIALEAYWKAKSGEVHTLLDLCGLIPGGGEPCDGVNGVLYLIEGDGVNAGLSFAATIPIAGWAATGAKYAFVAVATADGLKKLKVTLNAVSNLFEFSHYSSFRKMMGITNPNKHAHHLISWNKRQHTLIQRAAQADEIPFHMNNPNGNGIAIESWRNQQNHYLYDGRIETSLNAIQTQLQNSYGTTIDNIDPNVVSQALKGFQYYLYNQIGNFPNLHLDDVPIIYP